MERGVDRLHRRVRQKWKLVDGIEALCGARNRPVDVAAGFGLDAGGIGRIRKRLHDASRRDIAVRTVIPARRRLRTPRMAAHMWSPITAKALSSVTTSRTPGTARAAASSMPSSRPPATGLAATVPNFMPGTCTSMPNCIVPFTLAGVSSRFALVPISVKCAGSFSCTVRGTGSTAAAPASAPYPNVRPVAVCVTTARARRAIRWLHAPLLSGRLHQHRSCRRAGLAERDPSPRVEELPPVACSPKVGCMKARCWAAPLPAGSDRDRLRVPRRSACRRWCTCPARIRCWA